MADERVYEWRDPAALGRAVEIWLHLMALTNIAFGLGLMRRAADLRALPLDSKLPERLPSDMLLASASLAGAVAMVAGGVFVMRWIYQVSVNAHTAARDMAHSPASALWWYLVPFLSLFKPFQAMREVWQVSSRPGDWRAQPTPRLLHSWWAVFVVTGALNVSTILVGDGALVADALVHTRLSIAAAMAGVVTALLFARVVRELTALQVLNLAAARGRNPATGAGRSA